MTCDLPAHCRRNSIQASSYLANRRTGSEPSRDLLALTQREREERAPPDHRNKSTMTRHQTTNGRMLLAEGAPDLMQRVSRLPTAPHGALLRRRKPKPFPLGHKHHPWSENRYQMVLQRPLELAALTADVVSHGSD